MADINIKPDFSGLEGILRHLEKIQADAKLSANAVDGITDATKDASQQAGTLERNVERVHRQLKTATEEAREFEKVTESPQKNITKLIRQNERLKQTLQELKLKVKAISQENTTLARTATRIDREAQKSLKTLERQYKSAIKLAKADREAIRNKQIEVEEQKRLTNEAKTLTQLERKRGEEIRTRIAALKLENAELTKAANKLRNSQVMKYTGERLSLAFSGGLDSVEPRDVLYDKLKQSIVNYQRGALALSEYYQAGRGGTVGLEKTMENRLQRVIKSATEYGKIIAAAEDKTYLMGTHLKDVSRTFTSIGNIASRLGTATGQMASALGAMRGFALSIRNSFAAVAGSIAAIGAAIGSQKITRSLEQYQKLELSQIGFENFFGVSGSQDLMSRIRAAAVSSPLNASDIADYASQVSPLVDNSTAALNLVMSLARLIQYSGGEISTEMNYVIRNVRDVIAKGKANAIDINQFNRAMPALTKVFEEMELSEFLQNGQLEITPENASRIAEAFTRAGQYGDVGTIFEKTTNTISGLIEKLNETMDFFFIDAFENSGVMAGFKSILEAIVNDSNGLVTTLQGRFQFALHNLLVWMKSVDWEGVAEDIGSALKEIGSGLKDAFDTIKSAFGANTASTIQNIARAISNFLRGLGDGTAQLIKLINSLNDSWLGNILGSPLVAGIGWLASPMGSLTTGIARLISNFSGLLSGVFKSIGAGATSLGNWLQQSALSAVTFTSSINMIRERFPSLARRLDDAADALASYSGATSVAEASTQQETIAKRQNTVATTQETAATKTNTTSKQAEAAASNAAASADEKEAIASTASTNADAAETGASTAATQADIAEAAASNTAAQADLAEASASNTAAASSKISGAAASGSTIAAAFSKLLSAGMAGIGAGALAGTISGGIAEGISSAFGGTELQQRISGNTAGNLLGFGAGGAAAGAVVGGPIGAAIGGGIGLLAGTIKSAFESPRIQDEVLKKELQYAKERNEALLESGDLVQKALEKFGDKNTTLSQTMDDLNATSIEFARRLNSIDFSNLSPEEIAREMSRLGEEYARETKELIEIAASSWREGAEYLWKAWERNDIEGANKYAQTLETYRGWTTWDLFRTVLGISDDSRVQAENILKHMNVQDDNGADLTLAMWEALRDSTDEAQQLEYATLRNEVYGKFLEVFRSYYQAFGDGLSDAEKELKSQQSATAAIDVFLNFKTPSEVENAELLTFLNLYQDLQNAENPQLAIDLDEDSVKSGISLFDKIRQSIRSLTGTIGGLNNELASGLGAINNSAQKYAGSINAAENLKKIVNNAFGRYNGGIIPNIKPFNGYFANGGIAKRGVDTVPTMLQPGEYVIRRSTAQRLPSGALDALNRGDFGYFSRALGRFNTSNAYNYSRQYSSSSYDQRRSTRNIIKVINNSRGARLNSYYNLANRLA